MNNLPAEGNPTLSPLTYGDGELDGGKSMESGEWNALASVQVAPEIESLKCNGAWQAFNPSSIPT
jgi:hypothetical protein